MATQRELDELCRSGLELVHEQIDGGDAARAAQTVTDVQTARNGLLEVLGSWTAATLSYILARGGQAALASALDAEEWLSVGLRTGATHADSELARALRLRPEEAAERVAELMTAGDTAAAKAYWAQVEHASLAIHDYRVDWVTAVLSHVYRAYGADGLNEALLHAAEQEWWIDFVDGELAADPLTRVASWARHMAVANFGSVSITEEPDRFVLHHKVCGSCGRQELANRYESPCAFPRVAEARPELNFGRANDTIYRAHLAAWHFAATIERVGYPYPAIDCAGIPGRCWWAIYKDVADTPDRYWEMVGMRRDAAPVAR